MDQCNQKPLPRPYSTPPVVPVIYQGDPGVPGERGSSITVLSLDQITNQNTGDKAIALEGSYSTGQTFRTNYVNLPKGPKGDEPQSIDSKDNNTTFQLVFTYPDGTTDTTSPITKLEGKTGPEGPIPVAVNNTDETATSYELQFTYPNGVALTTGAIEKLPGPQGEHGTEVVSANAYQSDSVVHITFTMSDGSTNECQYQTIEGPTGRGIQSVDTKLIPSTATKPQQIQFTFYYTDNTTTTCYASLEAIKGDKGDQGWYLVSGTPSSETSTTYNLTFTDNGGNTFSLNSPITKLAGPQGDIQITKTNTNITTRDKAEASIVETPGSTPGNRTYTANIPVVPGDPGKDGISITSITIS